MPFPLMILIWNVRGAGDKSLSKILKNIIQLNHVEVLAVLEPRISGDKAMRVVNGLGFTNHHIVDANGFSGGIWLLWNCSNIHLNIVACSSQSITAMITQGSSSWILTVVYAHPCLRIKRSLWTYLDGVSSTNNLPWLVTGDFNEIVDDSEKKGGRAVHCNSGFADWIGRHHLVDLGFSGAQFTWYKKNVHGETLWERLDRGLCNITWRHKFPEGFVRHLPRVKSDHYPLLISLNFAQYPHSEFKIFRFQAMWMLHQGFKDFVSAIWNNSNGNAMCKTFSLTKALTDRNKEVFEKKLLGDLNVILEQEELFWLQKSRNIWLKEGDKNTKFFHLSIVVRKRRNKIEGLNDSDGNWTTEKSDMQAIVTSHFKDLFSSKTRIGEMVDLPQFFPDLDSTDLNFLNSEVADVDIKLSLFSIGGLKAPGPDGFPAKFFHDHWTLCSSDICDLVKDCFTSSSLPDNLNNTLIALVPKVPNALAMS
ncbi:PREDICTED: uncharacterized protein LOC107881841 [Prunus mume]|uniref:Uncharacterized protein LOC107881841 n=1 Tax=Prunus mume TaxID=102107 RepID=A0ABM1LXY7_PRUMU|nr:PREDICTED: uncharacterized protein LOC107881841 [Prunus mume]